MHIKKIFNQESRVPAALLLWLASVFSAPGGDPKGAVQGAA